MITICMCGDVMTGRGIDQVLPHPSDPALHEPFVKDAGRYVDLAEQANGPIPKPVDFSYVWGDALDEWSRAAPDVRIINLETSVTGSNDYWLGKEIHYRMNPANIGCLTAGKIDCCSLANNHVLDWGYAGLAETLQTLKNANVRAAGAGRNVKEAEAPVALEIPGKGRVVVLAIGSETSGIPCCWGAETDRAGVSLLDDMSEKNVERIQQAVAQVKRENDIVVASIHWGANWGYDIPPTQREFAHGLIDHGGIDVIHGHSSHHVKAIEVHNGRLILYGCGDFLDDYEGISGYEHFRDDLGLMYFASIDPATGKLADLQMTPTQVRCMSVRRAGKADVRWLKDVLNRESEALGVQVALSGDGGLALRNDQS